VLAGDLPFDERTMVDDHEPVDAADPGESVESLDSHLAAQPR
jgi:hypothetical protein